MNDEREEFGFTPDWRALLPFYLIVPKTIIYVGLPVWLFVALVLRGVWEIDVAWLLGGVALAGVRSILVGANNALKFRGRLECERIVADHSGLRILPPYGEWRKFPWREVIELSVVNPWRLFGDGFIKIDAGGIGCSIPPYVNNRRELLHLIRERANLTRQKSSWWGTRWTTGPRFPERER